MKKISKKEFFRLLINGRSAKIGSPVYPGTVGISDIFVETVLINCRTRNFRKVVHTQSNAIKFEDDSWMYFDKPRNCDSREAYRHDLENGKVVISLVDHRPLYKNPFGTPIREQTMMLIYLLES